MTTVRFRRTDASGLCVCVCAWCVEHHRRRRRESLAVMVYRTKVIEPGRCKWHADRAST